MGFALKLLVVLPACILIAFLAARMGVFANPGAPIVADVVATDLLDLNSCLTVLIWCNATISDDDTWEDIDNVNATLWDSLNSLEETSDDNSLHYTNYSCALETNISLYTVTVNCSFTVQYYANPSNWTCKIYANDSTGNSASNSTDNITINTLRALDAEVAINFGTLAPGVTSASDVNNTVTNCGNVALDLNLSGTNLTNVSASVTNITVGNIKYNVTYPGSDYTVNMTSLSASPTYANFSLVKRTTTVSTSKTYWKISVPETIENLIYSGTITFTAVEDT
jgi:hypothetical protein